MNHINNFIKFMKFMNVINNESINFPGAYPRGRELPPALGEKGYTPELFLVDRGSFATICQTRRYI